METNTQPLPADVAKGILNIINRHKEFSGVETEAVTRIKQIVASYIPIEVKTDVPQDQEQEADREASE